MKITSTLRHVHSENRGDITKGCVRKWHLVFRALKWVDKLRNTSQRNESLLQKDNLVSKLEERLKK